MAREAPAQLTQALREMYGGVVGNPGPSTMATYLAPFSYELMGGALIEPTPALKSSPDIHDLGGEKSAHWRRGHFRHQRVGTGRLEEKVIFIEPTLVRKDRLADEEDPAKKTYKNKKPRIAGLF